MIPGINLSGSRIEAWPEAISESFGLEIASFFLSAVREKASIANTLRTRCIRRDSSTRSRSVGCCALCQRRAARFRSFFSRSRSHSTPQSIRTYTYTYIYTYICIFTDESDQRLCRNAKQRLLRLKISDSLSPPCSQRANLTQTQTIARESRVPDRFSRINAID